VHLAADPDVLGTDDGDVVLGDARRHARVAAGAGVLDDVHAPAVRAVRRGGGGRVVLADREVLSAALDEHQAHLAVLARPLARRLVGGTLAGPGRLCVAGRRAALLELRQGHGLPEATALLVEGELRADRRNAALGVFRRRVGRQPGERAALRVELR